MKEKEILPRVTEHKLGKSLVATVEHLVTGLLLRSWRARAGPRFLQVKHRFSIPSPGMM